MNTPRSLKGGPKAHVRPVTVSAPVHAEGFEPLAALTALLELLFGPLPKTLRRAK